MNSSPTGRGCQTIKYRQEALLGPYWDLFSSWILKTHLMTINGNSELHEAVHLYMTVMLQAVQTGNCDHLLVVVVTIVSLNSDLSTTVFLTREPSSPVYPFLCPPHVDVDPCLQQDVTTTVCPWWCWSTPSSSPVWWWWWWWWWPSPRYCARVCVTWLLL